MKEKRWTNAEATIIPTSITELRKSGKQSFFDVYDSVWGKMHCGKKGLYDYFKLGEEIKVIVNGRYPIITGIVGVELPEKEIDEERSYPKESRPSNKSEALLYDKLKSHGWDITRRGWPDFACFKDGKFVAIEVKPKRSHNLKIRQSQVMQSLVKGGIKCYRWSPDGGFEEIRPTEETI